MKKLLPTIFLALGTAVFAADAPVPPATPAKPHLKIIPGKIIVPTGDGEMHRPWGQLVSIDFAKRTGTFRNESTNEIQSFIVMPYAELLHHASLGDLQDFRLGERAIFRLHQNDAGEWTWLTYIQDEMNMMNGHKEFYDVKSVDPARGTITCDWFTADRTLQREKDLVIETNPETHYWKDGQPAKFSDLKPGDKLRERSHGPGEGRYQTGLNGEKVLLRTRIAWDIFFDQASLDKFQAAQKLVHADRMAAEGLPAYVDVAEGTKLTLSMFPEGADTVKTLKAGQTVNVAPAGVDRIPSTKALTATIDGMKQNGRITEITLTLSSAPAAPFTVAGLARVWK